MRKIVFQTFLTGTLLLGLFSAALAAECAAGQICNPLQYKDIDSLLGAIINDFLIPVGGTVAGIMFLVAGVMFVTAAGDPEKVRTARRVMIYTAVGFAIILLASGLIKVLQSLLEGP